MLYMGDKEETLSDVLGTEVGYSCWTACLSGKTVSARRRRAKKENETNEARDQSKVVCRVSHRFGVLLIALYETLTESLWEWVR